MTTTETSVSPPANYPAGEWLPEGDYFWVSPKLHAFYVKAEPTRHQIERLFENIAMPGGGRQTVDRIVTDASGRYVKDQPIQLGDHESRGLVSMGPDGRMYQRKEKPNLVVVDPLDTSGMAYKTWLHDLRLVSAVKAAKVEATLEAHYQASLAKVCPGCNTANPAAPGLMAPVTLGWQSFLGTAFCDRCLPAVQLEAARRQYRRFQQSIDAWLDDHLIEWEPRPPQR